MDNQDNSLTVLVVGNIEDFLAQKHKLPEIADTVFCEISDLDQEFMEAHKPDIILSPLVTSQFDVMELAITLDQLDFAGRFRAITAPLPNPELISTEIRFECPALDFDLIILQPNQILRSI